ncbi:hypothetical protein N4G66_04155 [Streptomyces rhizosphaerihabitans]|nr:hypothetical protein [Streptomyces rhizosphaerihabitans]
MDGLVEFKTEDGALVVVEAVDDGSGSRLVARDDGTVQATRTFEGALEGVRAAAHSALRVFRDGSLAPDSVEIEFGVKLTAEAGALIAKSAVEGHLVVKLSWAPGESGRDSSRPAPDPASGTTPGPEATPGTGGTPGIGPAAGTGPRPGNGPTPGNGPGIPPGPDSGTGATPGTGGTPGMGVPPETRTGPGTPAASGPASGAPGTAGRS